MANPCEFGRRQFLEIAAAGAAAAAWPARGAAESSRPKPNIVYINIDDLGWADLEFQGSAYYETPHIDKLAGQGMVFTNAYAPAANCAPSRACCMTGQYTPRHGVYTVQSSARGDAKDRKLIPTENTLFIEEDNHTIADALQAAGYATCTVGKWHLSEDPRNNGFDINIAGGPWGSPSRGGYHSPYHYPNCAREKKGEYLTGRLTDEAIQFVRAHRDGPFFLYFPHYAVHSPLQPKKAAKAKYARKEKTKAHDNPAYAAMVESVDESIGRLMDTLDELGLAENTLVLFTSDNGGVYRFSKQWPLRAGKGSYYEGGIRVPFIMRWPGSIQPGATCDAPVSGIDFFPTLLDVTGARKPEGKVLDGLSLAPLMSQTGTFPERPLFWHFPIYLQRGNEETRDPKFRTRPGSVVRLGDWKLHEYFEDGGLELYNLRTDLGEKNNRVNDYPDKVQELHALLKNWRNELNAPIPSERNPEYAP